VDGFPGSGRGREGDERIRGRMNTNVEHRTSNIELRTSYFEQKRAKGTNRMTLLSLFVLEAHTSHRKRKANIEH